MTGFNSLTVAILVAYLTTAGILMLPKLVKAEPDHLVINKVQITGGQGHTTDDYVELSNPSSAPVDLKGMRLVKRTATSSTDTTVKSWTISTLIPAGGFYMWANSNYTTVKFDVATSETLATNNSIALRKGAANTGTIIDAVAWGKISNSLVEVAPYPNNPGANQSLQRKLTGLGLPQDTDNNSDDFVLDPPSTSGSDSKNINSPEVKNSLASQTIALQPSNLLTAKSGSQIWVEGVIAAVPGLLGKSIAFLADPALQLNFTGPNWPALEPGDQVSVQGKISHTVTYGTRLTVSEAKAITTIKQAEAPLPQVRALAEIGPAEEGALVSLTGKVVQISGSSFTLENSGERLPVSLKNRELPWPKLHVGQSVNVTGFVTLARGEPKLWARSPADIAITYTETNTATTIDLSQNEPNSNWQGYAVLIGLASLLFGAWLWQKLKLPTVQELTKRLFKK